MPAQPSTALPAQPAASSAPAAAPELPQPHNAIVAVTLNCNARCTMCDIWQNDMRGEATADVFARLPPSLRDINISGGEPFLRRDLPDILAAIKRASPRARLVISTNGFQPAKTQRMLPEILEVASEVAVRVSIDGMPANHEAIRGIPNGFAKCEQTLEICRAAGVRDLGIGFTLLEQNLEDMEPLYRWAAGRGLQMSITIALDSTIYFGTDKEGMRPRDSHALRAAFSRVIDAQYRRWNLKENFRGWFNRTLLEYHEDGKRRFRCDGGSGFFYMDSFANIYLCHILDVRIGNLMRQSWEDLWASPAAAAARTFAAACDKCWLICTSKSQIRAHPWQVGMEILGGKIRAHLGRRAS